MVISDWNTCPHCLEAHPGMTCLLAVEVQNAVRRIEARRGENVKEWARRLGNDLGQFTD